MSIIDTIINNMSPTVANGVRLTGLVRMVSHFTDAMQSLSEGRTPSASIMIVAPGDSSRRVLIPGDVLSQIIQVSDEDPDQRVHLLVSDDSGFDQEYRSFDLKDLLDAVTSEMTVANCQLQILSELYGPHRNIGYASLCERILSVASTWQGDAVGEKLYQAVSTVLSSSSGIEELEGLWFAMINPPARSEYSAIFKPNMIGEYTNTLGLSLYLDVDLTSIAAAATSVWRKVCFGFGAYIRLNAMAGLALANAERITARSAVYLLTDIVQDRWFKEQPTDSQDRGITNGFIELGNVSSSYSYVHQLAGQLRSAPGSAIAIITMGATWYLYYVDANLRLGFVKHMYDTSVTSSMLRYLSATGNDWNVLDTMSGGFDRVITWAGETSVNRLNSKHAKALLDTTSLISAGLVCLTGESIANRYYQDPSTETVSSYKWRWNTSGSVTPTTRAQAVALACSSPADSRNLQFALASLNTYAQNFLSGEGVVAHMIVGQQLVGSYMAMDDGKTLEEIQRNVRTGFAIAASAIAVMGLTGVAVATRNAAWSAVANYRNVLRDPNATSDDIRTAYMRMSRLCWMTGVTAGATPYTLNVNDTSVGDIARLITGK